MAEEETQNADNQEIDADALANELAEQVLSEAGLGGRPDDTAMAAAATSVDGEPANTIDLLKDVELDVKIELGRADMTVNEILHLTNGSVVELDKLAGDPVDILVNEKLVARGEVLVVNDNFCVRVNEIVEGATENFVNDTL